MQVYDRWSFSVWHTFPLTATNTCVPRSGNRRRGRVTHHWLWGAPSCRCGRCRTAAPASGPCTRTSPGPRSAQGQSVGRPSREERLYLQTRGMKNHRIYHRAFVFFCFSSVGLSLYLNPRLAALVATEMDRVIAVEGEVFYFNLFFSQHQRDFLL